MKMRLNRLSTRLGLVEKRSRSRGSRRQDDGEVEARDEERPRPCVSSPSRPNENACAKSNSDEAACDKCSSNSTGTASKTNESCLESVQNVDHTDVDINNKEDEVGNLDQDHAARSESMMSDDNDSDSFESYSRFRRGAVGGSDDDESDSEDEDDDDDLTDLGLPPGYLEFLSRQQNDVDDELSAVADRLRGTDDSGRCPSPVFQISFVREFVYNKGAVLIANAIKEGCSTCPESHGKRPAKLEKGGSIQGQNDLANADSACTLGARSTPLLPSPTPCRCPSNLREVVLSRCHIGDEGVSALAHAISLSGASLKTLDLSSNNITGVGVACLANCTVMRQEQQPCALGFCGDGGCSIDTLVLSSNPILSQGAFALATALNGQRCRCWYHQKDGPGGALTNCSQEVKANNGYCSLKKLHLSGCKLNDDDAQILGSALLPQYGEATPASPQANNLMLLNLHANSITLRGMEFLHSVIHNSIPDPVQRDSDASKDDSDMPCLQSLYSRSNHTMELGLIVDYGTRDYNYGHFFDQEEDEQLLMNMRNYEMTGIEPNGVDVEDLKAQMIQKWILKEQMMGDLHINRECAIELEAASEEEKQQIICSSARKKIGQVLEAKLHPHPISLPRRQDEYGKYLDEEDPLGLSYYSSVGSEVLSIGRHFTSLELNLFPQVFSWINRHCGQPMTLAMVFDILCENPDICSFYSESGKMPSM